MVSEERSVQPDDVKTIRLDWGMLKWVNAPEVTGSGGFSAGVMLLGPGKDYERHIHPGGEEILYFLGDEGEQTIEDKTRTVGASDMVYIPNGVEHSTVNTPRKPLQSLAVYCPPGPETEIRTDNGTTVFPPGELPSNRFARPSTFVSNFVTAGSLAGHSAAGRFLRNVKVARDGLSTRMKYARAESLGRIEAMIGASDPVIDADAGTGISAKFAERGDVDLLIVYDSGRYRTNGCSSLVGLLPYGDTNEIVVKMDHGVIPVIEDTPMPVGVNGTNPSRGMSVFTEDLRRRGFSGVQNFPTVGLIDEDGSCRKNFEETGMGYDREVEMIREVSEQKMLTCPYVFTEEQAAAVTEAGTDVIVSHMGLTTSGDIDTETVLDLDDTTKRAQAYYDAAKAVRGDVHVIYHDDPIVWPDDAAYVLNNTEGVVGFFDASSIEHLAIEKATESQACEFKEIEL